MAKNLVDLADYLLILILHNLNIANILAVRQVRSITFFPSSDTHLYYIYHLDVSYTVRRYYCEAALGLRVPRSIGSEAFAIANPLTRLF